MIFNDFLKALHQIGDPRFRRVLFIGLGLTVVLLIAVYAIFLGLLNWFLPDTMTIPWLGEVTWVDDLLSGASILVLLALSVFLMVPVASAFTSLFLDDVADAVEARHFP
ncbi:MAG: EI24 domain-containing protein, partial [Pseudomonadota bacterium]